MNSAELNEAIRDLEDQEEKPFECFGGKCVPYIGWYWRDVDFDRDECRFGLTSYGEVGFMEANKWGYPWIRVDDQEWQFIKALLGQAIATNDPVAFKVLNSKIQDLADRITS